MAKTQNLSLNPTKISGTCGRLMCCLKYEQDAYEDAVRRCPKNDSFVECPDGVGNITAVNLLREQVRVRLEDASDPMKTYRVDEIRVVRSGKGKRPEDYVAPPAEELEKLRYVTPEEEKARPRSSTDRLAAALESILAQNPAVPAQDTPAEPVAPEHSAEEAAESASSGRSRRRRNRGKKTASAEQQATVVLVQEKPAAPKAEKQPERKDKQAAQQQQPDSEQKKTSSRRRRGSRPEHKAAEHKEQQTAAPKAEKQAAPAAEGGEKKPNHHRRHHHRRGGGNKATPPKAE